MLTFLKTFAAIFGMSLIIPLAVWAGSGSLKAAWYATKRYWLIMGCIFGAGFILAGIFSLSTL